MKVFFSSFSIILLSFSTNAQVSKDVFVSNQNQNISVTQYADISVPAIYPGGNNLFAEKIFSFLHSIHQLSPYELFETTLVFKISATGKVLNISTYGKSSEFNNSVELAAKCLIGDKIWKVAKDSEGRSVVGEVKIPFNNIGSLIFS